MGIKERVVRAIAVAAIVIFTQACGSHGTPRVPVPNKFNIGQPEQMRAASTVNASVNTADRRAANTREINRLVEALTPEALEQGPLTAGGNIRVRTDSNGYLMAAGQAYTAPDGPLTTLSNVRVRTDSNGYLMVVIAGGTMTSPLILPNGLYTAPSLQWAGSAFDGFFWSSTGHVKYASQANPNIDFGSGILMLGPTATPMTLDGTAILTATSAPFVVTNEGGTWREHIIKVTVPSTSFFCNAVTCDVTVTTLPAKTLVKWAMADLTTVYACASVCTTSTLSVTLGKTAGGTQYLLSFDADAATGQFGDAAAELGASLAPSTTPTELGDLGSWTATTTVSLRMTSGTGNLGNGVSTNLSQGSMTFYIGAARMP